MADAENPFAGQGSVILDIGGDVGALVVTMPPEMGGVEVEIRPAGTGPYFDQDEHRGPDEAEHGHEHGHGHGHDHGAGHLPHVAVVDRPMGGELVPSLVYSEVVEGGYELCLKGSDTVVMAVDVRGGEVTQAEWPVG